MAALDLDRQPCSLFEDGLGEPIQRSDGITADQAVELGGGLGLIGVNACR